MPEIILKVSGLTKYYDDFKAVDDISFEVKEGEVVGLLGPNGAGKTTTIQMILSLLTPSAGQIKVFGRDLWLNREEILSRVNFAAPYAALPHNLTVFENLNFFAHIYGVPRPSERAERMIKEFKLERFKKRPSGGLSSGEQTRLALAKAFLNEPRLLLLDEPTASLDPLVARRLRTDIKKHARDLKGSVIWTSHNMREIESACDRIIFIRQGRIVAQGTPAELRRRFKKRDLEDVFIHIAEN